MELFKNKVLPTLSPDSLTHLEKKLFTTHMEETNIPEPFQAIVSE